MILLNALSRRLLVVVVTLLAAASCSDPGRVGVAEAITLRCGDSIESIATAPEAFGIIAGVAALPTAGSSPSALQTSEIPNEDRASRLFAKTGLLIRAGRSFDLVVPDSFRDRVAVGWGNPGAPTHRLIVPACPSDVEWLAFAGGIAVADPECITLEVVTDSLTESVELGVGEPCPGQGPPPYPSDT